MDNYRVLLGKVDVTAVDEQVTAALQNHERQVSCNHVHPQYDVYHPGGHPENGTL
jgi:hypothetical protein